MVRSTPAPYLGGLWARLGDLRCIVVVGLPGTGKSLLVRELAAAAGQAGRKTTVLQWDVCRASWERHPRARARYPEVDGVTHEGIRVAMGTWVRAAIGRWFREHRADDTLLIVEAPHIGGRFSELAHVADDETEQRLREPGTAFVVVAPEQSLQLALKDQRAADMQATGPESYEQNNASPDLLEELTNSLRGPATELGIDPGEGQGYDPDLYAGLMQHVLRHRNTMVIRPDSLMDVTGSVYELAAEAERLWPDEAEVEASLAFADSLDRPQLTARVEGWYRS